MTDPLGATTNYVYDGLGQETQAIAPQVAVFNTATRTTSNVSPTTVTTYDAAGEVTAVTDPNGNVTTYTYNGVGRLVSTDRG